ncbi:major facilitator superfamily domain-containing protein [Talaromyces proteolyticus]|uniref:Major facilitator superfamily domain-containing protein n=1 Tax=Talaromyces proteolyticus TaxID=1131652 RepID=A0AAD4KI22_9EURO|nr:major facilitator superfamily domain-containing protein [Talaromyces proteolyticus]KAH8692932.1 major facilitator superfamily domain-containing protein [Talaromyces proteolyticus]
MKENFIWITNSFFICATALTPLFGQLCDIFGRRWVFLSIVALFTLGSGICGGATSVSMLIAGRAIQGAGSGGIVLTVNIIVSDLCPLRKRGQYMAIILAIFGIGVALGPFIRGVIADSTTWRWVFWINLPIGGVSFVIMFFLLRLSYKDDRSLMEKIKRIDVVGNAILMAGTVAILYSLTYAGSIYSWSSWHTLVPLILGFLGFALFAIFETSGFAPEPVMPIRLLKHRTSIIVLINTFLNSMVYLWYLYYLPVYFQAVALYSSSRAGYSLIPQALAGLPGAIIAAISLSRWGKFKSIHFVGFAFTTLGMGLFSMVGLHTSVADWAVFQIITALGIGIVIDTLLPAFQAPASEQDQAMATSTWGFFRAFGSIWGVSIPAAIFNNRIEEKLDTISDARARELLGGGGAYQQASAAFVTQFSPEVQLEVRELYASALDRSFWVGAIFAGLACAMVLLEREVPLRKELDTEYGLEKPNDNTHTDSEKAFNTEN